MRALHIMAPGPMAGAERAVLGGVRALRSAGAHASLLVMIDARCPEHAAGFAGAARSMGLPLVSAYLCGRLDVRAMLSLRRQLRGAAPDVVHVHGFKPLLYALVTRPGEVALVASHHGETSQDRKVRLYEASARLLYRRCDRVVAVSASAKANLVERGLPEGQVVAVPNFLTLAVGEEAPGASPRAQGRLRLLYLGRLSPEKGLDILLDALRMLPDEQVPDLLIVGDGPLRAALQEKVRAHRLHGRVTFAGFAPDILPFLVASDAVVLPSLREGMPMALIEAAAAGKPAIATAVGGSPEVVRDGLTGILVRPGHPDDLALAIGRLERELPAFSSRCRSEAARVRREHSAERWAARIIDLYTDVRRSAVKAG